MIAMIRPQTLGPSGAASSRRDVLRGLGSVAVLGAIAATGIGEPTAAKRKKKGRGSSKNRGKTVTKTFTNPDFIAINTYGSATPFPSRIRVDGLQNATITDVDLVLKGFSHELANSVDVMLVAPDGRNALVMSDVGGVVAAAGVTLSLNDEAAADLSSAAHDPLVTGTFRPTNGGSDADIFDTTFAPVPSGNVALSAFDGGDPNGEWRLFIRDDSPGTGGSFSDGWELRITATVPAKEKEKHKKKR